MNKNLKIFILFILAFLLSQSIQLKAQKNSLLTSNFSKYGYAISYNRCVAQSLSDKTQAEIEHECARLSFEEKRKEMETKVKKIVSFYEKSNRKGEAEKFTKSQNNFMYFLNKYGELYAFQFLRTYPYHFYGSMIDLINLRLSHLEILSNELQ